MTRPERIWEEDEKTGYGLAIDALPSPWVRSTRNRRLCVCGSKTCSECRNEAAWRELERLMSGSSWTYEAAVMDGVAHGFDK